MISKSQGKFERYNPKYNELTYDELYTILQKAGAFQFLDWICCPKVADPTLHHDKSKLEHTEFISFEITHGTDYKREGRCTECVFAKLKGILDALLALTSIKDKAVEVLVWKDAIRQGGTVNKPIFQRELHPEIMTIESLVYRLKNKLTYAFLTIKRFFV